MLLAVLAAVSIKSVFTLLLLLAAIVVLAYLLVTYLPMPPMLKNIIYLVAGVLVLFVVLNAFGVFDGGTVGTDTAVVN